MIWKQYLDENRKISGKHLISKFPTNFLLDIDGKIIKRDISMFELSNVLKKLDKE